MCPSQNLESVLLAFLIKSQGWARVGLVYSTDSAGVSGAREFQRAASALGIQVVSTGAFLVGASVQDVYFGERRIFLFFFLFVFIIPSLHAHPPHPRMHARMRAPNGVARALVAGWRARANGRRPSSFCFSLFFLFFL